MKQKLAIITVVYENYSILDEFINSLKNQKNDNFVLYVADASIHKQDYSFPSFATVIPVKNKGYAHGINICLKKAIQEKNNLFCVINNDTIVQNDFVEKVLIRFQKTPSSIIGGKIYYASGYEYHKDRYQKNELGKVLWYTGGSVDWKHAITHHQGVDEVDVGQYNSFEKTDFVTGCLMCFDKKVIDAVGFWDESYFLYYEDADFCERAKRNKINIYYDPEIVIWHKNAQSTEGSGSSIHIEYQKKNQFRFGLKYAPLRTKLHLIKNYFI